jgi:CelD/BcsL family acetyltransferase involved in cellulose biosynthesis
VLLGVEWEMFQTRMSKSNRAFVKRKRKIAEREGPVMFECVEPDAANVDGFVDEVFRVEALSWKSRSGSAILQRPKTANFLREYARSASRRGALRLFFLRIGEATAAVRMNVEHANRLWELKIGYDERFSRSSPGILLMHETLRYACDRGFEAYEFLGQTDAWHLHWPTESRGFATLYFYSRSASGAVTFMHDVWRFARERARGRLGVRRPALREAEEKS